MAKDEQFISYAQNQEDVVLSRLLNLVPNGIFVDVGAGHPVLENVTYALYLHGWRGINIEPMATEVAMLQAARPEDETIQAAVGAHDGTITLFEAPLDNRGATTASAEIVADYAGSGTNFIPFEARLVALSPLLGRFEPGGVHVLKIDVEGMEAEVLQGADLKRNRPWVLVIEATEPNSSVDAAHRWEASVVEADYQCVLFDGLNRFYVRSDLQEVRQLLSTPANVLDNWISWPGLQLRKHALALEESLDERSTFIASLLAELATAVEYVASLESELVLTQQRAETAETYAKSLENLHRAPSEHT